MPGPFDDLLAKVTSVTGKWPSFAAFGSFFVYLVGYLALRFQLSAYGIATNLDCTLARIFPAEPAPAGPFAQQNRARFSGVG